MNLSSSFNKLNKIPLYLAIFLIPIFFLPFGQSILDFPKQILLLFLVFLSLLGWLGQQFIQGKIILKENKLLYLTLLFILVLFLFSTVFSLWPTASFFGWPLSPTDNFLTFFSFLLFSFLLVNNFQKEKEIFFALFLLLVSGALAGIFLLLQLYGIFILPFDFSRVSSFNTLGSVVQAAIFFALLLPLALVLAFQIKKPLFWLLPLILLGSVILVDFSQAWIVLLLEVLTLTIFSLDLGQGNIRGSWILALMILLVLSIFFIFFPLRFAIFPVLPLEVSPGLISEMEILRGVYSQGIKTILLGSGPGTFIFDYSQYRSPLLNLTLFWGTRFSSGSSEFLDWFITKGLLAGIALLFFLGSIIYFTIKRSTSQSDNLPAGGIKLGFLASAIGSLAAGFFSSFSFSLWFIFWIIIVGFLFYNSKTREINLDFRFRRLFFAGFLLLAIILVFALILLQGQKYLAEVNYLQGMRFSQQGKIDQAINSLQRAKLLNPALDIYWRDLAQLYLAKANLVAQDQKLTAEEKRQLTQENIAKGIEALNQTVKIAPFNVANWNVRGFFYRNLIGLPGAGEIALNSYQRAIELEPASPFAFAEIGRVHILMAQDFREKKRPEAEKESLALAVKNLEKSLELKSDYAPAHYLLAIAYDQQGKREEAIAKLEEIKKIFPSDIGIAFQLGLLYWRKENLDQAQREFEEIIKLNPDYSNARYMLGLIYDKKGEKEKAKEQFERVAQLNPENQEVQKILENLRAGRSALEGIIMAQPPLEEVPTEIQR